MKKTFRLLTLKGSDHGTMVAHVHDDAKGELSFPCQFDDRRSLQAFKQCAREALGVDLANVESGDWDQLVKRAKRAGRGEGDKPMPDVGKAQPMVFEVAAADGPSVGTYEGLFAGTQRVPFGDGYAIRFQFEIVGGDYDGTAAKRLAPEMVTPMNITGTLIAGILGRDLKKGEIVDLNGGVGVPLKIVVEAMPNGCGTRVAAVSRLNK